MNSHLVIYLGHHVRTLLIISQVISDAKLYLKYPSESAQLITRVIPENIDDSINQVCARSPPNRQMHTTTTHLPTTNEDKQPVASSTDSHSLRSNIQIKVSQEQEEISQSTPKLIDQHLEKLRASRLRIGPGTILSTFLISKFDYLTYLTIILNFLASGAALIWLPLLASIYFWAILTFPYPSRRFWHVITLTSMLILLIQ